jgi:hypothetical protein
MSTSQLAGQYGYSRQPGRAPRTADPPVTADRPLLQRSQSTTAVGRPGEWLPDFDELFDLIPES